GQGAGCCLVAEQIERLRRRADEDKAGRFAGPSKRRVLAQEAITWMNGVASALLRCRDDLQDIEIGRGAYTLKRPALIAASVVQRVRIVLGKDADGRNIHIGRGARDPDRDLTAIGNQ